MALSEVQICNLALGHIGVTKFIAALTDRSLEANVCNLYYEQARDFVLEDLPWPFATRYVDLGLVTDFTQITTPHDWSYAYRYPSDCVFARRIVTSVGRADPNPPPFKIGSDDSGRLLYTDQQDAILEYTVKITDPVLFTASFGEAVSWYLAGLICPGLARDRKQALAAFQMYEIIKGKAAARSLNEQQQTPEPESEMIRARE